MKCPNCGYVKGWVFNDTKERNIEVNKEGKKFIPLYGITTSDEYDVTTKGVAVRACPKCKVVFVY